MSVNRVVLVGNLGKDPELRYTPSGTAVCNFSIATTESYKDKDGQRQTKTEWHSIQAWRQLAEICGKFLTKGKQVYIEGKLTTRKWQDRDGNDRYTTEIVADQMQMLGRADDGGQQQGERQQGQTNSQGFRGDGSQYGQPTQQPGYGQQQQQQHRQYGAAPGHEQPAFNQDDLIPF